MERCYRGSDLTECGEKLCSGSQEGGGPGPNAKAGLARLRTEGGAKRGRMVAMRPGNWGTKRALRAMVRLLSLFQAPAGAGLRAEERHERTYPRGSPPEGKSTCGLKRGSAATGTRGAARGVGVTCQPLREDPGPELTNAGALQGWVRETHPMLLRALRSPQWTRRRGLGVCEAAIRTMSPASWRKLPFAWVLA